MSWDLLAYREKSDENGTVTQRSLGEWAEVKALVSSELDVEWQGPFWCGLVGDGFSIEINVGSFDSKEGDPVKSISFNVRGGGDPLPIIAEFCKRNNLTLHDLATGADIDLDEPSADGFEFYQAHRDDAIERARERHGDFVEASRPEPTTLAAAQERADWSGYLRDQPFAQMAFANEKFCNNFVAWTDELLFTGSVDVEVAESWQADLDAKGFFRIPDKTVKAPGPPIWYKDITRIEVEHERPNIRVRARDKERKHRCYSIRFADNDRKAAFLEKLIDSIEREYEKVSGVSPSMFGLLVGPTILATLATGIGYWLFSASTARWIAIVAAAILAFLVLGAKSGKVGKEDHYIYPDKD